MQIDRIDRHILTLLAADARMAVSTVAGTVGLSQSAATRRIQALEAAGMIEGYAARLGARRLGFAVTALVDITLGTQIEEDLERSEEHTSELQSLMRRSYADFCLKKKKNKQHT